MLLDETLNKYIAVRNHRRLDLAPSCHPDKIWLFNGKYKDGNKGQVCCGRVTIPRSPDLSKQERANARQNPMSLAP